MKKITFFISILFLLTIIGYIIYLFFYPSTPIPQGNCGKVIEENIDECCDKWADQNNIIKTACVGGWIINKGNCEWDCR